MNTKNKLIYIILIIIILILIALNIQVYINNNFEVNNMKNGTEQNSLSALNQEINTNYNTSTNEEDEQNRENKVATLNERQRMQTYFGRYLSYIESGDYQSAYDLLYDGFKQNYFPTLDKFVTYAQSNYPKNIVVEYTNIEREGTVFILTVKIRDALNDNMQTEASEQQAVITENNVNDFKLSFEVNQ